MKHLIAFLDDFFVLLGLVSVVTASYLINAIVGTYTLGAAFFIAALFAGIWLKSPTAVKLMKKLQKRK
jgi:hypothetical protein